jgi:hypothetical protein
LDDFPAALKKSSMAFNNCFKDAVLQVLGGDFEVVEGVTKYKMAKTLDTLAGIDLWHFNTKYGVRGVANRIQYDRNYQTFTIRKSRESGVKTEYQKRKYAIERDYLYPVLTFQGYLNRGTGKVLDWAIVRTKDIITMIDKGQCEENQTGQEQKGHAQFYIVRWQDIKKAGYPIYIYSERCKE